LTPRKKVRYDPEMNSKAVELLEEIQKLMQLKGENPFKIRAFEKAVQVLSGRTDLEERAKAGTLTELEGIGKGISEVLTDFLVRGKTTARDELAASLPQGLVELSSVPGLGPKKAMQLIEELGIHSIGELEYACRENRLLKLSGFGEKLQKKIMDGILFLNASRGRRRLDEAFPVAEELLRALLAVSGGRRVSETGALRRRLETLGELDFLLELPTTGATEFRERAQAAVAGSPLEVRLQFSSAARFGYELARTTATEEHWRALGAPAPFDAATEEEFYSKLNLPVIPPEARESGEEVELAREGKLDALLPWSRPRSRATPISAFRITVRARFTHKGSRFRICFRKKRSSARFKSGTPRSASFGESKAIFSPTALSIMRSRFCESSIS
jgi:DNA polymerase (family 10)